MPILKQSESLVEIWRLTNSEKLKFILKHVNNIRMLNYKYLENSSFREYTEEEILPLFTDEILSRINYLSNSANFEFLFYQDSLTKSKFVSITSIFSNRLIIDDPKNIILYTFEIGGLNSPKGTNLLTQFRLANITEGHSEIKSLKREEKINRIIE